MMATSQHSHGVLPAKYRSAACGNPWSPAFLSLRIALREAGSRMRDWSCAALQAVHHCEGSQLAERHERKRQRTVGDQPEREPAGREERHPASEREREEERAAK
jgi:hypothetical protein